MRASISEQRKQAADVGRAQVGGMRDTPRQALSVTGLQRHMGNQGVLALGARLQRMCSACASGKGLCPKCAQEKRGAGLQRRAMGAAPSVAPPVVHEVLRGAGAPLDGATRNYFESRMGQDFSGVRVHTGARAAESAVAVGARAYTVASHVVFGAGEYAPGSGAGRHVLAHELAHVAQQRGATIGSSIPVGGAHDSEEQAADRAATATAATGMLSSVQRGAQLRRLGANPGCNAAQRTTIHQAIYNARGWVNKAIPQLEATPLSGRATSALRRNFGATHGVAANAPLIVGRLRGGYSEISSIPFECRDAADATCAAAPCGFTPGAGAHRAVICTNATLVAGTHARYQAGCVLHESFHAAYAGFAGDSYSGWHGASASTAGYPGASPLLNADSYTTLAMDLS